MRLRDWILITAVGIVPLSGCGFGRGAHSPGGERQTAANLKVSDDAFAAAVHDLLVTEPGTQERASRLAGVEGRQMARAVERFKGGHDRGIIALHGGFYLMRVGELTPDLLGPLGPEALRTGAREMSARGDEGRARALFEALSRVGTPQDRTDAAGHLDALKRWTKDAVGTGGPLEAAGGLERVAVRRRLLEPSQAARDEAAGVVIDWIKKADALREQSQQVRIARPQHEEVIEAYRGLKTGPFVLVALYLCDADAKGALAALDRAGRARELFTGTAPDMLRALEAAAERPSADTWTELLLQMQPLAGREAREEDEFSEDRELFRAAMFAVGREAYRLDPTIPEPAVAVAAGLEEFGMAEAAPAVLIDTVRAHPDVRYLSGALAITMHAMGRETEDGDIPAARRTFKAAAPLLAAADTPQMASRVKPSPARVRAMMAEIELREGELDAARSLLKASAAMEKSGQVLLTLARIEWSDKDGKAAVDHLNQALTAPDTVRDHALHGEVLLTLSDIAREKGDTTAARPPLTDALKELVQARNAPDPDDRARVERVLSRVLDRFGADKPAQRALERAYQAAPRDKAQAAATIGLQVGRAFVKGDLPAARDGLTRAIAADLEADDVVYLALWVRLLEKQLRVPTDGAADRVFSTIRDDGTWTGRLAAFGAGKLRAEELIASAKTPTQKTEAQFYAAMDRRAAGDAKAAEEGLRKVVDAGGIQLTETMLARDILDGAKAQVGGPLPKDVTIP